MCFHENPFCSHLDVTWEYTEINGKGALLPLLVANAPKALLNKSCMFFLSCFIKMQSSVLPPEFEDLHNLAELSCNTSMTMNQTISRPEYS
jgi:hypothetical protein